jgi:hypothetical protein
MFFQVVTPMMPYAFSTGLGTFIMVMLTNLLPLQFVVSLPLMGKKVTVAADLMALLTTLPQFRGGMEAAVKEAATNLVLPKEVLSCETCPYDT